MKVLLVVDLQLDFLPGGKLPIPNGDRVIEPIKAIAKKFRANKNSFTNYCLVAFSRDWHDENSMHFKTWPVHCVQYTAGAAFPDGLWNNDLVFSKGMYDDDYSATDGLAEPNQEDDFDDIFASPKEATFYVAGLATDVCVKATVLALLEKGFRTYVLTDCVAGLDKHDASLLEMQAAGATLIESTEVAV